MAAGLFCLAASPPPASGVGEGIPPRVLAAYEATDRWCGGLRWSLVAAIGAVESGHGTTGGASAEKVTGLVAPSIFGPPLDGSPGTRQVSIGNRVGWWGLDGAWMRAVGPMQFLPATFESWAVDLDRDSAANPHDIDDAAATAANYLCGPAGEVTDERAAVLRYNHSEGYADRVLALADQLARPGPAGLGCPVAGPVSFADTWGAPRSGGRRHQGVDMFAARRTPVVAPVDGQVEYRANPVGGLSFHLWGSNGTYYYGTHLSGYGPVEGPVAAGAIVGFVGDTGNAAGTSPHLHFEIHPGRTPGDSPRAVNPTPAVTQACSEQRARVDLMGGR
jgi:hypothetical protein